MMNIYEQLSITRISNADLFPHVHSSPVSSPASAQSNQDPKFCFAFKNTGFIIYYLVLLVFEIQKWFYMILWALSSHYYFSKTHPYYM